MRTFIALTLVALLSQAAHARSAGGGAGTLGNFKTSNKKAPIASVGDLDRAKKFSGQARKRLGNTGGGAGWVSGGPGSWRKGGAQ